MADWYGPLDLFSARFHGSRSHGSPKYSSMWQEGNGMPLKIMPAIRKKYYCAKCRIAEYPSDPNPKLKTCASCYLVKYCGKECQVQDWSDHKSICKNRHKDLQKVDGLDATSEERYNLRLKLSDEALEFAKANNDYFAFLQAKEFRTADKFEELFVNSSKYPKWKEVMITIFLDAILEDRLALKFVMSNPADFLAKLAELLLTLIDARIPELDSDVEAYEAFEEILKSSPTGNLFNNVYQRTEMMNIVRKHLKAQNEKEFKAFKEKTRIVAQVKAIIDKMSILEQCIIFCVCIDIHPAQGCPQHNHELEQGEFCGLQLMHFFYRRPNMFQVLLEAWMDQENPYKFLTG